MSGTNGIWNYRVTLQAGICFATACLLLSSAALEAADTPSAELALTFRPMQQDVEYEKVDKADYGQCKVEVERVGKASGWVVYGVDGQILRRFWDTNADNVVDQWRYYDRGYEVYRDMDTNFNNKVDQSRWMNIAGTRWGLDTNEDGRLDQWKMISAEEASREAVMAMVTQDVARLNRVLVNSQDMSSLGLNDEVKERMTQDLKDVAQTMKSRVAGSSVIKPGAEWVRFDSSMLMPYAIPTDEGKANKDLLVYENVMAIVEAGEEPGFVQIGEMLQIGDVWKLTQIPAPIEGQTMEITDGGALMQPMMVSSGDPTEMAESEVTPKMRELLTELQKLDENAPNPTSTAADLARYNSRRVDILRGLLAEAKTELAREQWLTQMIDGLAAAVQTGKYSEGVQQLTAIENDLRQQRPNSPLIPYTAYRRLLADYTVRLQNAPTDNTAREQLQTWWLEQLKSFVSSYPKSEDAADALLQLAITEEFGGKLEDAKKWYANLVRDHGKTDAGQRAQGALRRIELIGKPLTISGKGLDGNPINLSAYRGKAVLVIFWATWCQPCTEDLPQIRALYDQYRAKGFEIVGINLDTQTSAIAPYIAQHGNKWPHIAEPDGLEGRLAIDYGIISVPTMFLTDKQGNVVSNSTSVEDLKEELPQLLP